MTKQFSLCIFSLYLAEPIPKQEKMLGTMCQYCGGGGCILKEIICIVGKEINLFFEKVRFLFEYTLYIKSAYWKAVKYSFSSLLVIETINIYLFLNGFCHSYEFLKFSEKRIQWSSRKARGGRYIFHQN